MERWEPQGRVGGAGRATKCFALVLIVAQITGEGARYSSVEFMLFDQYHQART